MNSGLHSRGNSIAEYALPTAIGVFVIAGAIGIFNQEIRTWFGNTMHFESSTSSIVQPLATLVNSSDVVANFNSQTVRDILGNLDTTCVSSAGACFQSDARYRDSVETSGGRGTKRFMNRQLTRILDAFDKLLEGRPDAEALKAKFRDLSNVGFEIANLQRKLADAIKNGDKALAAELIAQLNGGSVTYRTKNPDGTYSYTTVTGDQTGSLIDQLRALRNEIMDDPILASIPNAREALDALYDLFEFDAIAMSTMVDGPPPANAGPTIADMISKENSLLASAGQTTAGNGEVVKTDTDPKTKAEADGTADKSVKVDQVVNDTLKNIDQQTANEINKLATKANSIENYKQKVADNTAATIFSSVVSPTATASISGGGSGSSDLTQQDVAREVAKLIDAAAKRATESKEIDKMFDDGKLDAAERARLVEKTAEYLQRMANDEKNKGYITSDVAAALAQQLISGSNPQLANAIVHSTAVKKEESDIVERLTQQILTDEEKAEQTAKNGDGTSTTKKTSDEGSGGSSSQDSGSGSTTTAEKKAEVVESLVQTAVKDAEVKEQVNQVAAADNTGDPTAKEATAAAVSGNVTEKVEDKQNTEKAAADTEEKAADVEGQSTVTCKVGDGSTQQNATTSGASSCVQ